MGIRSTYCLYPKNITNFLTWYQFKTYKNLSIKMKKVLDVRLKRIAFIFLNEFVYLVFLKLRLGA